MAGLFLLAIISGVVIINYRNVVAVFRWATRVGIVNRVAGFPVCGDEVWWDDCGQAGCDRVYERIDALNSLYGQFLLAGSSTPKLIADLVWCKYYGNWKYEEGKFDREKKEKKELERARSHERGWKKCQ
jgi:hypothetical protein